MSYSNLILKDTINCFKFGGFFIYYLIIKSYQYIGTFLFYFFLFAYFQHKSYHPYDYTVNAENLTLIYWTLPAVLLWLIKPYKKYKKYLDERIDNQ